MIDSVLIIDDNDADQYLLRRLILKTEVTRTVFQALNGQEALDLLARLERGRDPHHPPRLLFLDINMPGMGAFDFLERFDALRASNADYSRCVVLIFSSSEHEEDRRRSLSYDFVQGYLLKPVTRDVLREVVAGLDSN